MRINPWREAAVWKPREVCRQAINSVFGNMACFMGVTIYYPLTSACPFHAAFKCVGQLQALRLFCFRSGLFHVILIDRQCFRELKN